MKRRLGPVLCRKRDFVIRVLWWVLLSCFLVKENIVAALCIIP